MKTSQAVAFDLPSVIKQDETIDLEKLLETMETGAAFGPSSFH